MFFVYFRFENGLSGVWRQRWIARSRDYVQNRQSQQMISYNSLGLVITVGGREGRVVDK